MRVSQSTAGGGSTYYLNDTNNPTGYTKAIEEAPTIRGAPVRSYVLGNKVEAQSNAGTVLQLITDGHGSTRAVVGATTEEFDYDAFGGAIGFVAADAATSWLFGGDGIYDQASGWTYHLARWRDDFRFVSYDSFEADPASPAFLHKFTYANANPTYCLDSSGQFGTLGNILLAGGILALLGLGIWGIGGLTGSTTTQIVGQKIFFFGLAVGGGGAAGFFLAGGAGATVAITGATAKLIYDLTIQDVGAHGRGGATQVTVSKGVADFLLKHWQQYPKEKLPYNGRIVARGIQRGGDLTLVRPSGSFSLTKVPLAADDFVYDYTVANPNAGQISIRFGRVRSDGKTIDNIVTVAPKDGVGALGGIPFENRPEGTATPVREVLGERW